MRGRISVVGNDIFDGCKFKTIRLKVHRIWSFVVHGIYRIIMHWIPETGSL